MLLQIKSNMSYMIEITENKVSEMSELVEDMLMCGGKLMSCLEKLGNGRSRLGHRMPIADYRDRWNNDKYENEDRYERENRRDGYRY